MSQPLIIPKPGPNLTKPPALARATLDLRQLQALPIGSVVETQYNGREHRYIKVSNREFVEARRFSARAMARRLPVLFPEGGGDA
ncbi:hypothetical protein GCG21_09730 [Pseudactinotalea sp. HY160]|uniref:hypothetical protein n=1 Tax=Pseudactinotalea sp. HY160 TaxID=2654490 RepID=UPI00128C043F|nr:hypothetical protein [Pseudactinotalea sp. HY160]MPV50277.1 hypothetical protein [Pseudactinotalea sp. HY160]